MSMRRLLMLVAAGAVSPLVAHAADQPWQIADDYAAKVASGQVPPSNLSLDPAKLLSPKADPVTPGTSQEMQAANDSVLTLDAGGTASRIHGFFDARINSQYITPRGLIAVNKGPQFQGLAGLVFDLYHDSDGVINGVSIDGGLWGDFNSHPNKTWPTGADLVSEVDIFAGFSVKFLKQWEFDYTIQAWTFPDLTKAHDEIDPTTEYNMDFKFAFDDSPYLKDFAMHPYVDVFWNFSGNSSPVVAQATAQGHNANTYYVEFGVAPSYTLKAISDMPITFTLPAYVSVGDPSFWGTGANGDRSALGVASVGLKVSAPLAFIPKDFGNWNAYVGVTYIHACNPGLATINSHSGTAFDDSLVLGYAGVGFGF